MVDAGWIEGRRRVNSIWLRDQTGTGQGIYKMNYVREINGWKNGQEN